ncbi:intracellular adhesion protein IcaD [Staphylococcus saccharolyticus]|uniref:intracellular adhesion protein IcaD n=1 Tax=Staphylococcus saccharolyticus TaxID=33028 RepID=UPI00102DA401|nr:intracellular adhesion protein IcaD [Staphylococcus saccharolyticus]MBL7584868.1 intracellular adhesion protein D [Staphylococcus saccharolyticus]MBL7639210.1 intracellular adhesion protein D [Staphylococcus saccharolyticus]QRJ68534.1 intracellular adhesion protein D [Staphylococcus saccharolyticus]TAA91853.1 intracellular adhesion protein D [Staphylococcus saccharolyticus]TAA92561.1 intracellular adhesion protein D [Staphylococcus saccharolyticus]
MVKPRQRKYPTVKSSLNLVRESLFIAISCKFWSYCIVTMVVYIGTLINSHIESVITIRIALNVENTEIYNIFGLMGIFTFIIFIFFTISIISEKLYERS